MYEGEDDDKRVFRYIAHSPPKYRSRDIDPMKVEVLLEQELLKDITRSCERAIVHYISYVENILSDHPGNVTAKRVVVSQWITTIAIQYFIQAEDLICQRYR